MKHLRTFCLLLVLSFTVAALGQATTPAAKPAPAPQAQTSPQPAPTIANIVDRQITQLEKQFVAVAEAMPDDKFDYTPSQLNTKDGRDPVRSFALEVRHVATANYAFWSPLTGDAMPAGTDDRTSARAEFGDRSDADFFSSLDAHVWTRSFGSQTWAFGA